MTMSHRSEAIPALAMDGSHGSHGTSCPAEPSTSLVRGVFAHLGSPTTYLLSVAIVGVTPVNALFCFVGVAIVFTTFILVEEQRRPAVALPRYTPREFASGAAMIFLKGVAGGGAVVTVGWWLLSFVSPYSHVSGGVPSIIAAAFFTDLGYYWFHRLLSHGRGTSVVARCYRRQHAAHHAVTELDFLRGNESSFVDTAVTQFQPSLIVASFLLGMDLGSTLAAYALVLTLQATDHTSVTYDIGWLRYVFMDNHAHKLHHCRGGTRMNHGAAFSIFDRLWGTYREDRSVNAGYLHRHRMPVPPRRVIRQPRTATGPVSAVAGMHPRGA